MYLLREGAWCVCTITWYIGIIVFKNQYERDRIIAEENLHRILIKKEDIETGFINDLVHELGTPMRIVMDNIDELKEELKSDSKFVKDKINLISLNGERISNLVNNFIDNAQSDSNTFEINLNEEDISDILKEIMVSYENSIKDAGHEIVYEKENVSDGFVATVDKVGLEHIFTNLIRNAIKYTPPGGTIFVRLEKEQETILISVADNGYGIKDNTNDIFEPYYRHEHIGVASCGIGLGLSIARKWVEAHNGTITFKSPLPYSYENKMELDDIRKGTEFKVMIPIRTDPPDNENL